MQPVALADVSGMVAWPASQARPNLKLLMFPEGLFADSGDEQDGQVRRDVAGRPVLEPAQHRPGQHLHDSRRAAGQYELWLRSVPANALAPDDPGPAIWGHTTISLGDIDR